MTALVPIGTHPHRIVGFRLKSCQGERIRVGENQLLLVVDTDLPLRGVSPFCPAQHRALWTDVRDFQVYGPDEGIGWLNGIDNRLRHGATTREYHLAIGIIDCIGTLGVITTIYPLKTHVASHADIQ